MYGPKNPVSDSSRASVRRPPPQLLMYGPKNPVSVSSSASVQRPPPTGRVRVDPRVCPGRAGPAHAAPHTQSARRRPGGAARDPVPEPPRLTKPRRTKPPPNPAPNPIPQSPVFKSGCEQSQPFPRYPRYRLHSAAPAPRQPPPRRSARPPRSGALRAPPRDRPLRDERYA